MFYKNELNILIAGAGSIGSVLGTLLAKQGHNVTFLRRKPPFGKLDIQITGERNLKQTIEIYNSKENNPHLKPDIIFITVQEQHTQEICDDLRQHLEINPHVMLVTMQNGIRSDIFLCENFADNPIIQGAVWWSATQYGPGKILYHRSAITKIGIPRCSTAEIEHLDLIHEILSPVFEVKITENIKAEMRKKLILNVVSPCLALVKQPYPQGLGDESVRKLIHFVFDEAVQIADEEGWQVKDSRLENFHKLLVGSATIDLEKNGVERLKHKVSTQIGIEKYGGKGSNTAELLSFFIARGGQNARILLEEVKQLAKSYSSYTSDELKSLLDKMTKPPCLLYQ